MSGAYRPVCLYPDDDRGHCESAGLCKRPVWIRPSGTPTPQASCWADRLRHIRLGHSDKAAVAEHNVNSRHRIQFHDPRYWTPRYGSHCQGRQWDWAPCQQYEQRCWLLCQQVMEASHLFPQEISITWRQIHFATRSCKIRSTCRAELGRLNSPTPSTTCAGQNVWPWILRFKPHASFIPTSLISLPVLYN
jgi:hypothetical protein